MAIKSDRTALKFNQGTIIVLLLAAFLFDQAWLVGLVAAVMLVGTVWPQWGLFKLLYARVVKPAGLLKPEWVDDAPQPHLFAQGLGALVLLASVLALSAGLTVLGWALAGVVVILAGVNLFAGFCVGCFIYYQLARRGVRLDLPNWRPA